MPSNYKKLGPYIREVNVRNTDLRVTTLLGVSIQKVFMPSIANTVGTDMSTYKIVKKNQFAYGPVTSRNGDKISVALLQNHEEAIISQAYIPFEVVDHNELDPEYLMMWFRRPEFDRYARFKSHGSARETFDWDEMCDTELPIPHIDVQRAMVKEYNTITQRIALNEQLNQKLEETAQTLYRHWFVDFEFPYDFEKDEPSPQGKPYKSSGGEMEWCEELAKEIPKRWKNVPLENEFDIKGGKRIPKGHALINDPNSHPYIKVADMRTSKYVILHSGFEYVDEETQPIIARYKVATGDLIISIVGTIGIIKMIDDTLDGANLTENCNKLNPIATLTNDYLYHYFLSEEGQREIEIRTVGGVQGKLPMYNIQSIPLLKPDEKCVQIFDERMNALNQLIKSILHENETLNELKAIVLSKMSTVETGIAGGVEVG